jgi:hypothetical protein
MRKLKRLMSGKLSRDKDGGIEGLPLQLIIIIMIATIGAAIIMGWMSNIDSPKYIGGVQVSTSEIVLVNGETGNGIVAVTVTDQDGNPLSDAIVILTGLGVSIDDKTPHGKTNEFGNVTFDGLEIVMKNSTIGFLTVNVSHPTYGEHNSTKIAVIG